MGGGLEQKRATVLSELTSVSVSVTYLSSVKLCSHLSDVLVVTIRQRLSPSNICQDFAPFAGDLLQQR